VHYVGVKCSLIIITPSYRAGFRSAYNEILRKVGHKTTQPCNPTIIIIIRNASNLMPNLVVISSQNRIQALGAPFFLEHGARHG